MADFDVAHTTLADVSQVWPTETAKETSPKMALRMVEGYIGVI